MEIPEGYEYALTSDLVLFKRHWPNLEKGNNFVFTSLKTNDTPVNYNCVAYSLGVLDEWIDMYGYFARRLGKDWTQCDHSVYGYAMCIKQFFGFEICDNSQLENNYSKIAIYGNAHNELCTLRFNYLMGNGRAKWENWKTLNIQR